MLKLATLTITADYQALGDIIDAFTDKPYGTGRNLTNGTIRNAGANSVILSAGSKLSAPVGNDDLSKTLAAGDEIPFEKINLATVFAKSASGSTLEIDGNE